MDTPHLNNIPAITTERLILRDLSLDDGPQMAAIRSNPEVNRYIDRQSCLGVPEAELFIKQIMNGAATDNWFYRAICLKENDELIGTACFWNVSSDRKKADLGYELMPHMQGKGIMHEALGAVLRVGFEQLGFENIVAITHNLNHRSISLLKKLGFTAVHDTSPYALGRDEVAFILPGHTK